jgi:GMP synthase-like glutamine amidotransferase
MKPILVLQHVPHENMASLETHFERAGLAWQYVELFRQVPPRLDLAQAAGLVVLGGPMNVDEVDKFPFLAREVEWIRQAVAAGLPLLGICLGAQLLAKAMGARVYPNAVKEIGWYEIELQPAASDDLLFAGSAARQTVFQWHGDTFDLPPGAVHLALSRQCRQQAFRCGRAAWGLQFHIEMTPALVAAWLAEAENCRELAGLDYIDPQAIAAETPQKMPAMQALGDRVLPRFVSLCV